jgi:hypothetical protein
MTDAKPSAVSRIMRLFAVERQDERRAPRSDEDRMPTVAEIERKLADRTEGFFWTWQYPGQW